MLPSVKNIKITIMKTFREFIKIMRFILKWGLVVKVGIDSIAFFVEGVEGIKDSNDATIKELS